jgi:hypothetical protein
MTSRALSCDWRRVGIPTKQLDFWEGSGEIYIYIPDDNILYGDSVSVFMVFGHTMFMYPFYP